MSRLFKMNSNLLSQPVGECTAVVASPGSQASLEYDYDDYDDDNNDDNDDDNVNNDLMLPTFAA